MIFAWRFLGHNSLPEVDLGVPLGIGTTSRLVSMVRIARAKEVIITGDRYTAEDLHSWGIINRLVAPETLRMAALDLAKRLIAKNLDAMAGSKLSSMPSPRLLHTR